MCPRISLRFSMRFQIHIIALALFAATGASASPFAETGNSQLRADVALLGHAGLIHDFSGQWPIPFAPLLSGLPGDAADPTLHAAAQRVRAQGGADGFSSSAMLGLTNSP